MIAKIETEKINPTYRLVQRIFVVLNSLPSVTKGTAGEVAFRPVFAVRETKSVREVVVILQSDEFKQLQVLRGNRNLGSIPERGISRRLLEPVRPELLLRRPVGSVMDEAFPTVSEDFPVERIIPALTTDASCNHDQTRQDNWDTHEDDLIKLIQKTGQ